MLHFISIYLFKLPREGHRRSHTRDIIRLVNFGDILNSDVEKEMGSGAVQSCGCTLMY